MRRFLHLGWLLALTLTGCSEPEDPLAQRQFFAFGTLVDVMIYGEPEARAQSAIQSVETLFNTLHRRWHPWEPGPLADLNQAIAAGQPFAAAPGIIDLVDRARPLSLSSGGRFNPAIGELIALWGFHRDEGPHGPPPAEEALRAVLQRTPSLSDLSIEDGTVTSANPHLRLDFGAFAKGVAVDMAVDLLRQQGIRNAIVNAGGDLRVLGRRGERAWRIGIRQPRGPGVLAAIEMDQELAVFTSGDYERFYDYEGRHYHHILDPHQGAPARGARSVTVLHPNAGIADAAATALFVAGVEHWQEVARTMDIEYVLLIDPQGVAHLTPAMAGRIRFDDQAAPLQRIAEGF